MALEIDVQRRLGDVRIQASFTATSGVTALFGHSGAGKSSIINLISGLLKPDRGRIVVDGRVLFDRERGIHVPPRHRRIGYIFQESRLFPHLKVHRNLLYGQRFTPASERYAQLDKIVELLGIGHLLDRRPHRLSGGERQRVAIGRALLSSPRLLLMDEPLASLDAARKSEILPYIERLRDELEVPIIYVSHQFEEVVRLADTLVVMAHGNMVAAGPLTEITSRFDLGSMTGLEHTGAVIEARVTGQDAQFDLTSVSCDGGTLTIPRVDVPMGTMVRLHVRNTDVAIAVTAPKGTSIQNMLCARLVDICEEAGPSAALKLDLGGAILTSRITRKSVQELGLVPGQTVYALIKSVALKRRTP